MIRHLIFFAAILSSLTLTHTLSLNIFISSSFAQDDESYLGDNTISPDSFEDSPQIASPDSELEQTPVPAPAEMPVWEDSSGADNPEYTNLDYNGY